MKKIAAPFMLVLCCILFSFTVCANGVWAAPGQDPGPGPDPEPLVTKVLTEDTLKVLDPTNQDILDQMHRSSITGLVGKMGIDMVMSILDMAFDDTGDQLDAILNELELLQKNMDAQFDEMSEEIASAQLSQYMLELDKAMALVVTDMKDLKALSASDLSEEQRSIKVQELRNSINEHNYDEVINLMDILIKGDGVSKSLLDVHKDYINAKYAFQGDGYYNDRAALYNYLSNARMMIVLLQMNYDMSLDGPLNPLGNYYQSALKRYNNLYDFINNLTETMDLGELYDTTHMTVQTDGGTCRVMVSNRNEDKVYLIPRSHFNSQDFFDNNSYNTSDKDYEIYDKNDSLDDAMSSQKVAGVSFHLIGESEAEALGNGSQGNIDDWLEQEFGFTPGFKDDGVVVQLHKDYKRGHHTASNLQKDWDYCEGGGAIFSGELMEYRDISAESVCTKDDPDSLAFIYCGSAAEFAARDKNPEVSAEAPKTVTVTDWANLEEAVDTLNSGDTLDLSQLPSNADSEGADIYIGQYPSDAFENITIIGNGQADFRSYIAFNPLRTDTGAQFTLEDINILLKSPVPYGSDGIHFYDYYASDLKINKNVTISYYGDINTRYYCTGISGIFDTIEGCDSSATLTLRNLNYGIEVARNKTLTIKNLNMIAERCKNYAISGSFVLDGGTYIFDDNSGGDFNKDLQPSNLKNLPMVIATSTDDGKHEYSGCGKLEIPLTDAAGNQLGGQKLYLKNYATGERQPFTVWQFDEGSKYASYNSTFSTFLAPGSYSIENSDDTLHTPYFTVEAGKHYTSPLQLTDEERPLPTGEIDNWAELAMMDIKNGQTIDLAKVADSEHYTFIIPNDVSDLTIAGDTDNHLNLTIAVDDSRTEPLRLTVNDLYILTESGSAIDIAKNDGDNKLIFKGDNSMITEDSGAAGIRVPDITYTLENPTQHYLGSLTLESASNSNKDKLVAKGGSGSGKGAGIGGNRYELAGKISITSGTVYATGNKGAGIGGGSYYGSGGEIYISGGDIKAESTGESSAIGGGANGDSGSIAITGGNITLLDQRGASAGIGYAQGYPKSILPNITRPSSGSIDIQFANLRSFNSETSLAPIIYTKDFNSAYTAIKAVIMESPTKRLSNYDINIIDSNSGATKAKVTTWGADTANDKLSGGTIYTYLPTGSYSFQSATDASLIGMNRSYPTGVIKSNGANLGEVDLILSKVNTKSMHFDDVVEGAWYHPAVAYAFQHYLMIGTDKNSFAPKNPMTRSMVVTILARLSKEDISGYEKSYFSDVDIKSWYGKSVAWAYDNDIIEGIGQKKFNPNAKVTREEFVKMFYYYAKYVGIDAKERGDISKFSDGQDVSDWAEKPMQWAIEVSLINGYDDGTLRPQNNITRAEAATMLYNFIEYVMP